MANLTFFDPIFFPGRRVRIRTGPRPPGVSLTVMIEGVVLRAVQLDDKTIKVEVETGEGDDCRSRLYDKDALEVLSVDEDRLRADLVGRAVHFPRSSGIGISFPDDAGDDGVITLVRFARGSPQLVVHVATGRGIDFVTPCDFSQCDLVPCGKKDPDDP